MDYTYTASLLNQWMAENHMTEGEMAVLMGISENHLYSLLSGDSVRKSFAGYEVIIRGGTELSMARTHQVQQIALLLNEYERLK